MREKITQQYDSWYTNHETVFGKEPIAVIKEMADLLPEGTVLDIGGGEGRNAVWLAEQGVPVEVTDLSQVGLDTLSEYATEHELPILARQSDVVVDGIEGQYAGIVMAMVLHHINTSDVEEIIKSAQAHTIEGGVHAISTFKNEGELYERNEIKGRFYADDESLARWYEGWDIIRSESREYLSFAKNKDGTQMKNLVTDFLAQKPIE